MQKYRNLQRSGAAKTKPPFKAGGSGGWKRYLAVSASDDEIAVVIGFRPRFSGSGEFGFEVQFTESVRDAAIPLCPDDGLFAFRQLVVSAAGHLCVLALVLQELINGLRGHAQLTGYPRCSTAQLDQLAGSSSTTLTRRQEIGGQTLHIGVGGHQLTYCTGFVHAVDPSRPLN